MSSPLYIPVTPETHAMFYAQLDELDLGSDAFVRRLLHADDCLQRIAKVAAANGDGTIGASFVRELAELELPA